MPDTEPLTIGETINLLREEFPDVSVSKVRFLESQGLLAPGRSEGGYRLFDEHDLARLRFILRQQRDHFLPLKVIKSKLTLWERGEESGDGGVPEPSDLVASSEDSLTRDELLRRSGLDTSELKALVEHGLLEPLDERGEYFESGCLQVATDARRLLAAGFEARHLRTIRHAADREADLIIQLVGPLLRFRQAEPRQEARSVAADCGEAILAIHRELLATDLRRHLEP